MSLVIGIGQHIAVNVSQASRDVVGVVGGVGERRKRVGRIDESRKLSCTTPAETPTDSRGNLFEEVVVDD